ncbi:hypothetical protein [uncultured Aliiroseovarius sp.]|uniref:hypothetical protein n=1 Tax=uncultured Aliiroseovarius sp. TaxID=1658783 RepID=UPI002596ED4B|nr:hypothetical protein [uncultured Aliiroseovarius sp.]
MNKYISKSTTPVFVWMIAFVVLLLCGFLFWQTRHLASSSVLVVLGLLASAMVSLGVVQVLVSTPSTFASIGSDGEVTFTWRYLTHSEHKVFHPSTLGQPTVVERIDSDGDSHWSTQLVLPDDTVFLIAEYGVWEGSGKNEKNKKRCEVERDKFVENLLRAGSAQ